MEMDWTTAVTMVVEMSEALTEDRKEAQKAERKVEIKEIKKA